MAQPLLQLNTEATDIVQAYTDDCRETALVLAPERQVFDPKFSWDEWNPDEQFEAKEDVDLTDRRSPPNMRDFTVHQHTAVVKSYALGATIPQDDVEDALAKNPNLNPINFHAESLARELWRLRLKRVLKLYGAAATYPPENVQSPPNGKKLTDRDWDAVRFVLDCRDSMLVRPNTLVFSNSRTWTAFRTHPSVVEAIKGTGAGQNALGAVSKEEVAQLFELDQVVVVNHLQNQGPRVAGQQRSKQPLETANWATLALLDPLSQLDGSVPSFAMTAIYRPLQVFTVFDPIPGVEGVTKIKVAWRGVEVIKAKHAGFLLQGLL